MGGLNNWNKVFGPTIQYSYNKEPPQKKVVWVIIRVRTHRAPRLRPLPIIKAPIILSSRLQVFEMRALLLRTRLGGLGLRVCRMIVRGETRRLDPQYVGYAVAASALAQSRRQSSNTAQKIS